MSYKNNLLSISQIFSAAVVARGGQHVLVDSNAAVGDFAVLLPANPSSGDVVRITLTTGHATRKVTIDRNGNTIDGSTNVGYWDLLSTGDSVEFTYLGTGWIVSDDAIKSVWRTIAATMSWIAGVGALTAKMKRNTDRTASFYFEFTCTGAVTSDSLFFTPTNYTVGTSLTNIRPVANGLIYDFSPGVTYIPVQGIISGGAIYVQAASPSQNLASVTQISPATWAVDDVFNITIEDIPIVEWAR